MIVSLRCGCVKLIKLAEGYPLVKSQVNEKWPWEVPYMYLRLFFSCSVMSVTQHQIYLSGTNVCWSFLTTVYCFVHKLADHFTQAVHVPDSGVTRQQLVGMSKSWSTTELTNGVGTVW